MRRFLRSIGAVLGGFLVATFVMMCIEYANGHLIYPDLGKAAQGVTDREAMRALMSSAPVGAFLVVLLGWALGAIAGGWTAASLAARARLAHALVLGALLTLLGVLNNLMLTPPSWFWLAVAVFLPCCWLGAGMAGTKTT